MLRYNITTGQFEDDGQPSPSQTPIQPVQPTQTNVQGPNENQQPNYVAPQLPQAQPVANYGLPANVPNSIQNIAQSVTQQPTMQNPVQQQMAPELNNINNQPNPLYSLANGQGGPGMSYNGTFVPQTPVQPVQPQVQQPSGGQPQVQQPQIQPSTNAQIIAQNESGNNPNIGYHYEPDANGNRTSTAYGTYGITAPAYQDIQKADPYFKDKPITSLSKEEQDRAFNSLEDINKKRLTNLGIEPTDANLRLAHFFGAGGAAKYLSTGYVNPQAAAANGGPTKVDEIAKRLVAGLPTRVSQPNVPVNPQEQTQTQTQTNTQNQLTPAQQGINAYQQAQNNIPELIKLSLDKNQPEFIQKRAGDQAMELYQQQKFNDLAKQQLPNKTPKEIADIAQGKDKSSVGSWMQYLLYNGLGLKDLANEKADELGIGHAWQSAMDDSGNTGMVRYTASGKPLEGVKSDGTPMTPQELNAYASMGNSKNISVGATPHHGIVNGEVHTFATRTVNGQMQYKDSSVPDSKWTMQAPEGFSTLGYQDPQHIKGLTAANAITTKMAKANADAVGVGGRPIYTEQQIEDAKNQAYQSMTGKPYPGYQGNAQPVAQQNAQPVAQQNAQPVAQQNAQPVAQQNAQPVNNATTTKPKSQAQAILDYDSPPPVGPTTPAKTALLNEVQRLAAEQGKTWDAGQYKIANKTKQDFTTTGKQGQAVQSMNTAIAHLDTLNEAGRALQNGQVPVSNAIVKEFATSMGLPEYTNFESVKHIVSSEVAKAVSGTGGSALADRQAIEKEFNSASSPAQLQGVIKKYQELMAGQVNSLRQTYTSAGLSKESFDKKLLPRTQQVLNSVQQPSRSNW